MCFTHVFGGRQDKLSPTSSKCVFLGYSKTQKGYCCHHPPTRRMFITAVVTFFKNNPYYSTNLKETKQTFSPSPMPILVFDHTEDKNVCLTPCPIVYAIRKPQFQRFSNPPNVYTRRVKEVPSAIVPTSPSQAATHSNIPSPSVAFVTNLSSCSIRNSLNEAILGDGWCQAMENEIRALHEIETWILTDLPAGKKAVGCRWVYTVKFEQDGSVERLKARLVAKGCTQTPGVDYETPFLL